MTAFLWIFVAGAIAVHLGSAVLAAIRYRPAPEPKLHDVPSVSLIRPVFGVDPFDRETLASSFMQDLPGVEIVFCAEREDDPAVALVRDLIAEHPDSDARLLIGDDKVGVSPKLNNIHKGYVQSRGEVVVVADSNLLLPPEFLRAMIAPLRAGIGAVSAPPVGIRPGNLWGAVECAFLNTHQLRWQYAADAVGEGVVHGKAMALPRDVIEESGGFAALGPYLAEDVAIHKMVRAQGRRVRLAKHPFPQPIGRRSRAEVWARQLRWSRVRREGYPAVFLIESLQGGVPPVLALSALVGLGAAPGWMVGLLAVGWYGTELLLARIGGWPRGPRDLLAMILRDAMMPLIWLATWRQRGIAWRGRPVHPSRG